VDRSRSRGIIAAALLMIIFGLAEVTTGVTHNFFGISTAKLSASAYAGAAIGVLYAVAGLLVLSEKKRAAAVAVVLLIADVIGRIAMVATGLYPVDSLKQILAMTLGTCIVAAFAIYIRLKWASFS
jgi:hypothetical protein